jgi:protein TonB
MHDQEPGTETEGPLFGEQKSRRPEIWSSILVVLVIAAAVLLGVVVGWRKAATGTGAGTQVKTTAATPPVQTPTTNAEGTQAIPEPANSTEPPTANPTPKASSAADAIAPPSGGLVVTQNGKVIYRSPSPQSSSRTPAAPASTNRLIYRVEPEYPPEARAQHLQGAVVLDVQVLGGGTVGKIAVLSGNPQLAAAAIQAVKQWQYLPYLVDGHAVDSQAKITIRFTMPPS